MLAFASYLNTIRPLLVQGAVLTLISWLFASMISLVLGMMSGIVQARMLDVPIIGYVLRLICAILRGVPLYAQLIIAYFVIPAALNLNTTAFATGVITLGICSAAYTAEIIRGAINSIASTQWEAARVLGFSTIQQLYLIILPQAGKRALPSLVNEYINVMKSTSLLAGIGVLELTKIGMNIIARSLEPIAISIIIALIYLIFNAILIGIGLLIERWLDVHSS